MIALRKNAVVESRPVALGKIYRETRVMHLWKWQRGRERKRKMFEREKDWSDVMSGLRQKGRKKVWRRESSKGNWRGCGGRRVSVYPFIYERVNRYNEVMSAQKHLTNQFYMLY